MDSIKIAHIADAHLGCAFADLDKKKRALRRQEIKMSFANAINTAFEHNVDVLLIAGDIFDNAFVDKETISFVKNTLNKANVPVFIAPGNHDPYTMGVYNSLKNGLNDNITIFENSITKHTIDNVNIYGFGFDKDVIGTSALAGFKADEDAINIMVLHAGGVYNPVTDDDIKSSQLSYLALGHTHEFSGVQKSGNTYWAYWGTHDGHGFDELGEKGILIGTVSKDKTEMQFVPTSSRVYNSVDINVSEFETVDDIINSAKSKIDNPENLYKFVLTGRISSDIDIDTDMISSVLSAMAFYVEIKDKTTPSFDLEMLSKDYSLKGIVAKNLIAEYKNATTDEETELLNAVSTLLITSIEGGRE